MREAMRKTAHIFAIALMTAPLYGQSAAQADASAPKLEFVYEELVTLGASQPVGETPQGKRNIVPITGGTFAGPRLKGHILPGGWDWQLANPGGCFTIHADYMIQTEDGVIINVRNSGTQCTSSDGKRGEILTSPVFEAPKGKYDWLNGGVYVGTLEGATVEGKPAVRIRFYHAVGAAPPSTQAPSH
ncbi:DUF3237 domain-containing protein [Acidobacteria bacterium AB60]|nr:DUF3237 domain-containing protein [Acidobacteria bacterium AB60]